MLEHERGEEAVADGVVGGTGRNGGGEGGAAGEFEPIATGEGHEVEDEVRRRTRAKTDRTAERIFVCVTVFRETSSNWMNRMSVMK